jgi:hypothetical protein
VGEPSPSGLPHAGPGRFANRHVGMLARRFDDVAVYHPQQGRR